MISQLKNTSDLQVLILSESLRFYCVCKATAILKKKVMSLVIVPSTTSAPQEATETVASVISCDGEASRSYFHCSGQQQIYRLALMKLAGKIFLVVVFSAIIIPPPQLV